MYKYNEEPTTIWYNRYLPRLYIPVKFSIEKLDILDEPKVSKLLRTLVAVYKPTDERKEICPNVYRYAYHFIDFKFI